MQRFLDLADRGRYEQAARYLDVSHDAKRGEELARKLYAVLGERLLIIPDQLSPLPHGRVDLTTPGTIELGKIKDAKNHTIAIRIVRHEARSPEDEARWVFSQNTVESIDPLYASLRGRWVREHLPSWLLLTGPLSLYYWQWATLPALAIACIALGRLLAWLMAQAARIPTEKLPWARRLVQRLQRPVTMAWALFIFYLLFPYLALTIRAEELLERLLRALGYLTFFWALFRTVTVAGDEVFHSDWAHAKPSARALSSVGVKLGKVVVAVIALMVALTELGYPVTSVVAGLGIGGVALALAAQKTVENLFGSVAIIADQPFRIGDTIRVDTIEGTVESIGLRSTRMRTADRTLIIIPNGKLADMRIESLGQRDRIRFSVKLGVDRSAKPATLRAIVTAIYEHLTTVEEVRKDDIFVRFSSVSESSYDIDVVAMVESLDIAYFAKVREELLLACISIIEKNGGRLSLPTRQVVGTAVTSP